MTQNRELAYASRQVNSIEINGSFYSLQRPTSYRRWHDETPEGFVFSVKGGRYITHIRRLREAQEGVANFFASGVLCLGEKLGPILWQLPPSLKFDPATVAAFLELLPQTTEAAADLGRRHGTLNKSRVWTKTDADRRGAAHDGGPP